MSAPTGPLSATYSDSEGPAAYSVTMNGRDDVVSASIIRTVHTPLTRISEATSRPNRGRNSWSSASSGRRALTATWPPSRQFGPEIHHAHAARTQPGRQPVAPIREGS